MKSCEYYELLASLVLDGEATGSEQAELTAHLETCPACQAYFEDIRRIHAACARESAVVPEGFAVRVMDRVRETGQERPESENTKKKVIQFPHWKRWTALAACCAVAVLSVWVYGAGRLNVKDAAMSTDGALPASMDTKSASGASSAQQADVDVSGTYEDSGSSDGEEAEALSEAPPEIPEEYQDLAKSAVKDGEGEGQYAPLVNDKAAASQEPAAAAAPPANAVNGGAEDLSFERDTSEPDRDEAADIEPDEAEPGEGRQPAPGEGDAPEEPVEPEPGPAVETEETEGAIAALEPVEVLGVPEQGILTAYGSAARRWVEDVLGAEWAAGGSYPLTAEQYGDLLLTLDEAGEPYNIIPGEGYCLMTD